MGNYGRSRRVFTELCCPGDHKPVAISVNFPPASKPAEFFDFLIPGGVGSGMVLTKLLRFVVRRQPSG